MRVRDIASALRISIMLSVCAAFSLIALSCSKSDDTHPSPNDPATHDSSQMTNTTVLPEEISHAMDIQLADATLTTAMEDSNVWLIDRIARSPVDEETILRALSALDAIAKRDQSAYMGDISKTTIRIPSGGIAFGTSVLGISGSSTINVSESLPDGISVALLKTVAVQKVQTSFGPAPRYSHDVHAEFALSVQPSVAPNTYNVEFTFTTLGHGGMDHWKPQCSVIEGITTPQHVDALFAATSWHFLQAERLVAKGREVLGGGEITPSILDWAQRLTRESESMGSKAKLFSGLLRTFISTPNAAVAYRAQQCVLVMDTKWNEWHRERYRFVSGASD